MTRPKKRRTPRYREDLLGLTGAGAADRSQQEVRGTDEHEKGLSEGARGMSRGGLEWVRQGPEVVNTQLQ